MSEIRRLHKETERLVQQSLDANLLFIAYLLDIARLELDRQLKSDNGGIVQREHCLQIATGKHPDAGRARHPCPD